MKPSRVELDAGPAKPRTPPHGDPPPRTVMAARRDDESDEQRREEPLEEPGYGHGV